MRTYDVEADTRRSFAGDVAEHRLIVRLDQGLHRHLVFERQEHSWNNRFELITVPGSLTIVGDRGAHIFRRDRDMFAFFRSRPDRPHRINVDYWAEKLPGGRASVKGYSEEVARQLIKEHLDEAIKEHDELRKELVAEYEQRLADWREDLRAEGIAESDVLTSKPALEDEDGWPELLKLRERALRTEEILSDAEVDGTLAYEDGARDVLHRLEEVGLLSDVREYDLTDYDFHFVWCLHAITWGIQQYDRAVAARLHTPRTGPAAWDTPLPTTAPAREPNAPVGEIVFTRRIKTFAPDGGVL